MKKLFFILLFISFNNFSFAQSGKDYFNQGFDAEREYDYEKASQFYEKACNVGNYEGCNKLGVLYYDGFIFDGKEFIKDKQKASQLFEKACNAGIAMSCLNLKNFNKASQLFEKACNAGENTDCHNLGIVLNQQGMDAELKLDVAKAVQFYGKSCIYSNPDGCSNLGDLYDQRQDYQKASQFYEKAFQLYKKSCNAGDGVACFNLKIIKKHKSFKNKTPNFMLILVVLMVATILWFYMKKRKD